MSTSGSPRSQPDLAAKAPDVDDDSAGVRTRPRDWANRGVVSREGQSVGWVVVADEAIARILTTTDVPGELEAVEALTDPAAHTKEGELHVNDAGRRTGRVSSDAGRGSMGVASVTASAGDDNRHLEAGAFARRVAQHLSTALQKKRYATLRIVAAPRFLGALRGELDAAVKAVVMEEIDKDLIHMSDADIAGRLSKDAP